MTTLSPEAVRPSRLNIVFYVLTIVLLYLGDLVSGVWLLFSGLNLATPYVSLSSILNWVGAWVLCYFAYRRSKAFGYVLVALTVVLTVLIIIGLFFVAVFLGTLNDA